MYANLQERALGDYWKKEEEGIFCFGQALAFATENTDIIITRLQSGDQYCVTSSGNEIKEWNGRDSWVSHYRTIEWFLQSDWTWRLAPEMVYKDHD